MTGEKTIITPSKGASVKTVKELINALTGIPVSQQHLIFSGKYLGDSRRLNEANVREGSTVYLVDKSPALDNKASFV